MSWQPLVALALACVFPGEADGVAARMPRSRYGTSWQMIMLASMVDAVPSRFVDVIRGFDSHERDILFQWAAGAPFSISGDLRAALSRVLQTDVPVAPFIAMDYTLDWLSRRSPASRTRGHGTSPNCFIH